MAKESPKSKNETPFQRFERLVRKIVGVPKAKTREPEERPPS
jgi:hypothetical protein